MKKPSLITMSDLWDHIELLRNEFKKVLEVHELQGTLLLSEIVTDLRCNYNWLVKQIDQGNLKAYFLKEIERKRGGYRVERKDYEEFKKSLQFDPSTKEYVFIRSIDSIVKDFQLERGLNKKNKQPNKIINGRRNHARY
ncbi:MAG TPA: hypothetical protein PLZ15_09185 [Melioribacteraceae bacterium]|nr:hypothetical protein [Melioribacteraceae bacterium]